VFEKRLVLINTRLRKVRMIKSLAERNCNCLKKKPPVTMGREQGGPTMGPFKSEPRRGEKVTLKGSQRSMRASAYGENFTFEGKGKRVERSKPVSKKKRAATESLDRAGGGKSTGL